MKKNKHPVVECLRKVRSLSLSKHETTFTIIILSLFLISCKSTEVTKAASKELTVDGLRPIYITNTKKVRLLMPAASCGAFEGLQLLNGSFGASSFTLLSYTQIDASGISLSLMNDFGTDMGNVFFDGRQVIFDSAYFPKALPGEYIVCDIQNAYYDANAVRKNLEGAGLKFEVTNVAAGTPEESAGADGIAAGTGTSADLPEPFEIRKILDGKKVIEEITILKNTIKIKNYLRGYEYNLTLIEE